MLERKIFLYRFEKFTTKRLDAIRNRKLWASAPSEFNDLDDCRFEMIALEQSLFQYAELQAVIELLYPDGKAIKQPKLARLVERLRQIVINDKFAAGVISPKEILELLTKGFAENGVRQLILDTTAITCFFSSEPTNALMWAHYGNDHYGFCTEYEVVDCLQLAQLHEVIYSSKLPTINDYEFLLFPEKSMRNIVTTKLLPWAHEKEWRLVETMCDDLGPGKLIDLPEGLRPVSIILGARFDPKNYSQVDTVAQELNISVKKMRPGPSGLKVLDMSSSAAFLEQVAKFVERGSEAPAEMHGHE